MSINWVMLSPDGCIVPKLDEKILHTSRPRVALDLSTPAELQLSNPYSLRCDNGVVFITNERVIYLPAIQTEQFQSFFAPILNFTDTHVQSSWAGIGPWSWLGILKPVASGGIPFHIPRLEAKLTFKDGGHHDFQNKFAWLKERLHHAQELGLVPGQNIEPPPPYQPRVGSSSLRPATANVEVANASRQPQVPGLDEPPPDYAEAQTLSLAQHEERTREDTDRS